VTERGVVSFVGLGPGDAKLWAERAGIRLSSADAVIDDEQAPVARMIELARQGKRVVRTVVGDPFESPRCVAEALRVASAGVDIEVVPAISAAGAAGAFAGVVGRAVLVSANEVASALAGTAGDTPVTLVSDPSLPSQRVLVTTAAGAADWAQPHGRARVLVAFGVPHEGLRWFEHRPLFGRRVLLTRAREQSASAAALLRDQGADVVVVPTIEIRDPVDPEPLARALADLRAGAYAWAAFTSANGVEQTWKALVALGGDARAFGPCKIAAIGPATARALESRGLRADVIAKEFVGESLAREILAALRDGPIAARVLLARAAKARDVVPEALRSAGCRVDVVAAYETHPAPREAIEALAGEIEQGRLDVATFTSSSTVENFCDLLGPRAVELLKRVRVATIGPVTTETARVRGVRVDVVAREYTVPGLIQALAESYEPPGRHGRQES
jgi:uroporphyrinogen III methyltransferase/synthase